MNARRLWNYGLLIWACVGMLCACGSNTPGKGTEPGKEQSQVGTEQTLPSQTEAGASEEEPGKDGFSLEELYEKTDRDRIYKLSNVDVEGYALANAYMKDGYVLLLLHDYSEEGYQSEMGVEHMMSSGKLVLFPLDHPDEIASRDVERFASEYHLLSDGQVMTVDWEGNYSFYDSKLEDVQGGKLDCIAVLGAADDGAIWGIPEESVLALYQDGKEVSTYRVEDAFGGSFLGEWAGKAYFSILDFAYENTLVSVDLADGSVDQQDFLYQGHMISNDWISYESPDRWYLANMEDPYMVTAFDKPLAEDFTWKIDENYLIATYTYKDEPAGYHQSLRVYDRANGGLLAEQKCSEPVEEELLQLDMDQGLVLFGDVSPDLAAKGLYLWDLNGLTAEKPAEQYETLDYHVDQERIDSLVQEIHDRYGVTVYWDQAHLDEFVGGYHLSEMEDKDKLGHALLRLLECMEEYPKGFFEELKSGAYQDVVYYLSGVHERTDEDIIEYAAGTASADKGVLRMTLDVNYWWDLRRTFLHENMHLMDDILEIETASLCTQNIYSHWYNEINSPEIASMQQYNYEQSEENMKGVYQYDGDPEEAWYIDAYSKSTMSEDRARILENSIYSTSDCYFESSHINRKARCINAEIREVFACVKNSAEPVLWEARTGIVDLHEEFPELFK